jgi:hypothetical protein
MEPCKEQESGEHLFMKNGDIFTCIWCRKDKDTLLRKPKPLKVKFPAVKPLRYAVDIETPAFVKQVNHQWTVDENLFYQPTPNLKAIEEFDDDGSLENVD